MEMYPRRQGRAVAGTDSRGDPRRHAQDRGDAGPDGLGVPQQGRAADARRGGRLSAVAARPAAGGRQGRRQDGRALAARRRAVLRARVQDHDRPVHRHADFLAGLLGHAGKRIVGAQLDQAASASGSAGCSRCTPTSARRSPRSSPATSARSGLRDTTTGDTLCDPAHPIVLESIEFPEPVIQIAIEPKTKADQEKLGESLQKLAKEDPSFRVSVNRKPPDADRRDGRVAPGNHRRSHAARIQSRRQRRQAAGRLPRDHPARVGGRGPVRAPERRSRTVRRGRAAHRAARRRAAASNSRTAPRAARSRATSSRRSKTA